MVSLSGLKTKVRNLKVRRQAHNEQILQEQRVQRRQREALELARLRSKAKAEESEAKILQERDRLKARIDKAQKVTLKKKHERQAKRRKQLSKLGKSLNKQLKKL